MAGPLRCGLPCFAPSIGSSTCFVVSPRGGKIGGTNSQVSVCSFSLFLQLAAGAKNAGPVAIGIGMLGALNPPAQAEEQLHPPHYPWDHTGPFSSYDASKSHNHVELAMNGTLFVLVEITWEQCISCRIHSPRVSSIHERLCNLP